MAKRVWKLKGYDTFSNEWYSILDEHYNAIEYRTLKGAEKAARKRLRELESSQPSASSGGQGAFGIQDRVFIEGPDGEMTRFIG